MVFGACSVRTVLFMSMAVANSWDIRDLPKQMDTQQNDSHGILWSLVQAMVRLAEVNAIAERRSAKHLPVCTSGSNITSDGGANRLSARWPQFVHACSWTKHRSTVHVSHLVKTNLIWALPLEWSCTSSGNKCCINKCFPLPAKLCGGWLSGSDAEIQVLKSLRDTSMPRGTFFAMSKSLGSRLWKWKLRPPNAIHVRLAFCISIPAVCPFKLLATMKCLQSAHSPAPRERKGLNLRWRASSIDGVTSLHHEAGAIKGPISQL